MRGGSEGVQPLLRITSDTAERDGLRAPPASVGALWGENAAHRPPKDESTNQGLCTFLVCCLGSAGAHGAGCLLARRPGNPCFQKGVKHISLPPGHGHQPTASPDRDRRAEKPPPCSQRPKARGVPPFAPRELRGRAAAPGGEGRGMDGRERGRRGTRDGAARTGSVRGPAAVLGKTRRAWESARPPVGTSEGSASTPRSAPPGAPARRLVGDLTPGPVRTNTPGFPAFRPAVRKPSVAQALSERSQHAVPRCLLLPWLGAIAERRFWSCRTR